MDWNIKSPKMYRNLLVCQVMKAFYTIVGVLMVCPWFSGCGGDEKDNIPTIRIAAASGLKFALEAALDTLAQQEPGFQTSVTYGSSGNMRAQIEQGAPFDLFFSADANFVHQLVEAGAAEARDVFPYAIGRIVIWVRSDSAIVVETLQEQALLAPGVRRIALANPRHAPYGMAAVAALRHYDLYDDIADRLVFGENIMKAAHYLESGAADIGIIALSLALAPPMRDQGRFWEIPLDSYPRMNQAGVIVGATPHRKEAGKLVAFLQSPEGRKILQSYGFIIPEDP